MRVDARKVVTVLFCDIVGFTALSGELDPESLRHLMSRYFDAMKGVLQHHGGTIEKYIGDAIMAIFGVPRVHEDDALRAVSAAAEMRRALSKLNEEFERNWGVTILTRTGVNTGEVVTSDASRGDSFVTADAVNVAARLEQAAEPGHILIGDTTYRLVSNAVVAEAIPPLTVKGKVDPLRAWRLLNVVPTAPGWGRRLDSPLMGRESELAVLEETLQRSAQTRTCEMVTLIGAAGVGKSRLGNEFLSRVSPRVRVVTGRCLPYGEGITFWPVIEVLRDIAGIDEQDSPDQAQSKVSELVEHRDDAGLISERIASLLRLSDSTTSMQETFWAVRKVFEEVAGHGPLVVVFDDIHSGEPTFLDLVEYLVDWMRDVPLTLLCLARHELLESRGAWLTGKANASLLHLQPLTQPETTGLMQNLLGGADLVDEAHSTITDIAEGNPLFIEETLRMLIDNGSLQRVNGSWNLTGTLSNIDIPPTIHAVLAARLDRLEEEERSVIERASVVGRMFWWGAVSELSSQEQRAQVGSYLQSLVRKELIRPDHSETWEEDAFRFMHILVRDAAYGGIPKATRAELHQRFAHWIETKNPRGAGEYEEIVGFHLEQAYLALAQLAPTDA
ncbi:MAG: AAA family ATPase, partial [Actinobacteria bacterium]|nr:AAA family ATPase [Actinomycetota bacterium]